MQKQTATEFVTHCWTVTATTTDSAIAMMISSGLQNETMIPRMSVSLTSSESQTQIVTMTAKVIARLSARPIWKRILIEISKEIAIWISTARENQSYFPIGCRSQSWKETATWTWIAIATAFETRCSRLMNSSFATQTSTLMTIPRSIPTATMIVMETPIASQIQIPTEMTIVSMTSKWILIEMKIPIRNEK